MKIINNILGYSKKYEDSRYKCYDPKTGKLSSYYDTDNSKIRKLFIHEPTGTHIIMEISSDKYYNKNYINSIQNKVNKIDITKYKNDHKKFYKNQDLKRRNRRSNEKILKSKQIKDEIEQNRLLPIPIEIEERTKRLLKIPLHELEYNEYT